MLSAFDSLRLQATLCSGFIGLGRFFFVGHGLFSPRFSSSLHISNMMRNIISLSTSMMMNELVNIKIKFSLQILIKDYTFYPMHCSLNCVLCSPDKIFKWLVCFLLNTRKVCVYHPSMWCNRCTFNSIGCISSRNGRNTTTTYVIFKGHNCTQPV